MEMKKRQHCAASVVMGRLMRKKLTGAFDVGLQGDEAPVGSGAVAVGEDDGRPGEEPDLVARVGHHAGDAKGVGVDEESEDWR